MKGELETAQAECAKATQLEGQFDRTLKDSKTTQEQRDAAYKAWQAAEVCPSPATLTFSDLAVNHLLCPSLRQCMRLCVTLCTPFTKLWSVAKLPWGFSVALLQSVDAQTACRVPRSAPCAAFCWLWLAGPTAIPLQLLICNMSLLDSGSREGGVIATEAGTGRLGAG